MARSALRRATPRDAEAVRALTRAAYAKWVPLIGREPRPMTKTTAARWSSTASTSTRRTASSSR